MVDIFRRRRSQLKRDPFGDWFEKKRKYRPSKATIANYRYRKILLGELIPNPNLTTDPVADGWVLKNGAAWDQPNAQIDIPDVVDFADQVFTPDLLENGVDYKIIYTLSNYTGNGSTDRIRIYHSNAVTPFTHTADGTYEQEFTAVVTTKAYVRWTQQGAFSYSLDYCSLQKA